MEYSTIISLDVSDKTSKVCVMTKIAGRKRILEETTIQTTLLLPLAPENGLTRRYMKADLKGQMLLYERGYSTRENVIRGVRTDAWHLENTTGYIPKWLDEFK